MMLAACALLASGATSADTAVLAKTTTRFGNATTTFSCMGSGACHYLLLNSLCQERMLDSGTKERNCSYTEAARFILAAGQKKTVANLPADFLYAMKNGADPTPQDVLNAPVPH